MRKLLVLLCVSLAIATASAGCDSGDSVEIPDQPVPPPQVDPVKAGSSVPPAAPNQGSTP
jgi:hypothetical protein